MMHRARPCWGSAGCWTSCWSARPMTTSSGQAMRRGAAPGSGSTWPWPPWGPSATRRGSWCSPATSGHPSANTLRMLVYSIYRQSWRDSRLRFSHFHDLNMTELSLNWIFLDNIWKPDTYVLGGRESFLHRITSPNRLVRLAEDGTISYSQRLTLATSCRMKLRKFPLDSQTCRVELSSFGYTLDAVGVKVAETNLLTDALTRSSISGPVRVLSLSASWPSMITPWCGTPPGTETHHPNWASDRFSRALRIFSLIKLTLSSPCYRLEFILQRTLGFYFLRTYFPLVLIVASSWVSFWLVKTPAGGEIVARVGLGITCCLGMVPEKWTLQKYSHFW